MSDPLDIKAIKPNVLANLLAAAYRRDITVDMVNTVVAEGGLLSSDGAIDLREFVAYLLKGNKVRDP